MRFLTTLPFLAVALSACMAAETTETSQKITSFDIKGLPFSSASDAAVRATKSQVSNAQVQRLVMPASLPARPGAIEVKDALAGTAFGAMAGGLMMAQCDGAVTVIRAQDSGFSGYGEDTSYTICLWPYRGGTRMDVHSSFTRSSGGFSAETIGRDIAASAMGDSSQFIDKTEGAIVSALQGAGGRVAKVGER